MKKLIKLFTPKFDSREITVATKALKSSQWASGAGTGKVLEFEKKFKRYVDSDECVAVNSGTAALHLAINVLNIKDKEVLVPALTFISTVHSIVYNGGKPIFVDVIPETMCIDPNDMKAKISSKTKAVIPVHFGGLPCDMNRIRNICRKNNLYFITDAAHACGAQYGNKKIGTEAEMVCFSYHPVKNLAMPKGGAITINGKNKIKIKNKLNSLRWCGIDNRKNSFYDVTSLGYNYYMDEISAAIGIEQLKKINLHNNIRKKIAKRYNSEIDAIEKMPFDNNCSYHLYWLRVKNRNQFIKNMFLNKIEVGTHYKAAHMMSYYKSKAKLPVSEKISNEVVTLPLHPSLTNDNLDFIIKSVNSFLE